jgi:hypothetical protein
MGEMSEVVIAIIKAETDLCIFCKGKRKDTGDKTINTDKSLIPIIINKVVPYRNLEEIRLFYKIDDQDPYFFYLREATTRHNHILKCRVLDTLAYLSILKFKR